MLVLGRRADRLAGRRRRDGGVRRLSPLPAGLGVPFHQVETFHVHEHRSIVRRAGGRQDAHDGELASVPFAFRIAVGGGDAVADLQLALGRDHRSHDRFKIAVLLALALKIPSLGELELAVAPPPNVSLSNKSGVVPITRNRPK